MELVAFLRCRAAEMSSNSEDTALLASSALQDIPSSTAQAWLQVRHCPLSWLGTVSCQRGWVCSLPEII